jgi:hypothetical protein
MLLRLPPLFSSPDVVMDQYLWVPRSTINIKLRTRNGGSLKLKRLERTEPATGIELWVERPDEEYAFPISPDVVSGLWRNLNVTLPSPTEPLDRARLLLLLEEAREQIQLISVKKRRETREHVSPGGPLLVEITCIEHPERVSSISVEDGFGLATDTENMRVAEAHDAVAEVVNTFGLARWFRRMNYLEALELWSAHKSVTAPEPPSQNPLNEYR